MNILLLKSLYQNTKLISWYRKHEKKHSFLQIPIC